MDKNKDELNCWAIVEILGRRAFAGLVSEQAIGGTSFVRIDVPSVSSDGQELPAFTKLFGAGSIYAISPCTEETARAFAAQYKQRSFSIYEAPRLPAPADRVMDCGHTPEDACCCHEDDEEEEEDDYDEDDEWHEE